MAKDLTFGTAKKRMGTPALLRLQKALELNNDQEMLDDIIAHYANKVREIEIARLQDTLTSDFEM